MKRQLKFTFEIHPKLSWLIRPYYESTPPSMTYGVLAQTDPKIWSWMNMLGKLTS